LNTQPQPKNHPVHTTHSKLSTIDLAKINSTSQNIQPPTSQPSQPPAPHQDFSA
jgi:hypothetical protein